MIYAVKLKSCTKLNDNANFAIERGVFMIQVNVTVQFSDKYYHTNVITNRDSTDEEIFEQALNQVQKQWKK